MLTAGFVGVALTPYPAKAHLVTTGLGPLYDGAGHFMLSPEDWVPVLALALLAGLRGAQAGRCALFLLPVAWLAGGVAGLLARGASAVPIAAISSLVLGALVASDLRLSPAMVAALALALGLLHGFFNGTAMGSAEAGALALVGVMATVFLLVAPVTALVVSLKQPWTRIVVRVAGSWIAAIGLLLLGWSMRERVFEKLTPLAKQGSSARD